MTMVPHSEWEWYGLPGHFICGQWCRFHLCTLVGHYVVSSVGEYIHPRHSGGSERAEAEWMKDNWPGEYIGRNRKYETMVFHAAGRCNEPDCMCGQPDIDPAEVECRGCNTRKEATENHMAMCHKYAEMQ